MSIGRRLGAAMLVTGLGAFCSSACVKNESSLFVKGCAQIALDSCTATASADQVFLGEGLLDTFYTSEYTCALLVGNQLVPQGDPTTLKTETSRVQLTSADINILDSGGNLLTRTDGSVASATTRPSPARSTRAVGPCRASGSRSRRSSTPRPPPTSAPCRGRIEPPARRRRRGDRPRPHPRRGRHQRGALPLPHRGLQRLPLRRYPIGSSCCSSTDMPAPNCRPGEDGPVDCRFVGATCACQFDPTGPNCPC